MEVTARNQTRAVKEPPDLSAVILAVDIASLHLYKPLQYNVKQTSKSPISLQHPKLI